jgi:hypothetical protein
LVDEDPPPSLIVPETGQVTLRLYPYHLERRHGPWPVGANPDEARRLGLPFPFLPGAEPVEVRLRGGLTPQEVGPASLFHRNSSLGRTVWWDWDAYARTPFGWDPFPTVFFESGRLVGLALNPRGAETAEAFTRIERTLAAEIGPAHEASEIETDGRFGPPPNRPWLRWIRRWRFDWGEVALYHEARDWTLEVSVRWRVLRS